MKFHKPDSKTEIRDIFSRKYDKKVAEILIERIEDATVEDWISIDTEELGESRYRITVWATEVSSDSDFYDEWYSQTYGIQYDGEVKEFEIDIQ